MELFDGLGFSMPLPDRRDFSEKLHAFSILFAAGLLWELVACTPLIFSYLSHIELVYGLGSTR